MMEIIPFSYSSDFPISFTNGFINYLNSEINGKIYYFIENEIIVPVIIKKKIIFNIGYFIHTPLKKGKRLTEDEEVAFMNLLYQFAQNNRIVDFIFPPIHFENFNSIPPKALGKQLGIIKLNLANISTDELFMGFKPIYRNLIRKAQKDNVEVKFGAAYFDDFYTIYSEKLKQEKASFDSYDKIKKLISEDSINNYFQCGVAYLNGNAEAGILNLNDKKNSYYLFAGTSDNSHPGALRLIHWELIKKYKEMGLYTYSLGAYRDGTGKQARLTSFKMGFGSSIQEGYHFTFIINPFKYWLYTKLLILKSRFNK